MASDLERECGHIKDSIVKVVEVLQLVNADLQQVEDIDNKNIARTREQCELRMREYARLVHDIETRFMEVDQKLNKKASVIFQADHQLVQDEYDQYQLFWQLLSAELQSCT